MFGPIAWQNIAHLGELGGKRAILNVPANSLPSMNVLVTNTSLSARSGHSTLCRFEGLVINSRQDDSIICDQIKFHITNINPYIGEIAKYPPSSSHRHRMVLEDSDWEIYIDSVENADELIKDLGKCGGYAITHVGILQQKGIKPFCISEAKAQLKALGYILSFAEGRWCNPIFIEGSLDGSITYRDISGRDHIDPWEGNWKWCPRSADCLKEAYARFMSKWRDPNWRRIIRKIIPLYIRANIYPVVELSVVDSFTALENLVKYRSERRKHLSDSGSERLSWIIKEEKLDKQSPPKGLFDFYDEYYRTKCTAKPLNKQANGAEILNDFRNGVVHRNKNNSRPPLDDEDDPKLITVPFECRLDAENLGLWYVEMAILHEIGYNGRYENRLTGDCAGYPPWAAPSKISSDPDITVSLPGIE